MLDHPADSNINHLFLFVNKACTSKKKIHFFADRIACQTVNFFFSCAGRFSCLRKKRSYSSSFIVPPKQKAGVAPCCRLTRLIDPN
jgi:hypothetical protein